MTKRLIIDLAACDRCDGCSVGPAMLALRERATFELICRRCEHASCVAACPFDALERTDDGIIKRHNMRCVSCKSCSLACPFGTIYMELLPFYSMSYEAAIDVVVGAALAAIEGGGQTESRLKPLPPCRCDALEYREIAPDEKNIHIIDDFLAARARRWDKSDRGEEAA
jgi:ferredoxin